jgi:hypothetical protein
MPAEEVLEEKILTVEGYLKLFAEGSADYEMVRKRAENLASIKIVLLKDASGRKVEDTTFFEKTGVQYTIRSVLD